MGHKYAEIAFTDGVKQEQETRGSRLAYARMESGEDSNEKLTAREADFISLRDSFYMASIGESGWPYLQHRGGPRGFVKIVGETTIGFANFKGNRQYVSLGNFTHDERVSLFFMDYVNRKRLKLYGRVQIVQAEELVTRLVDADYKGKVEEGILIHVAAFDWNCPQHITPRFTLDEIVDLEVGVASISLCSGLLIV